MLTFQNIYEECQEQTEDTSAESLVLIKRGINQGAKKFGAVLGREWRTSEKTFSTVANQQFYQMPEDALRPRWVTVTVGGVTYPLEEIADPETWHSLNMRNETSSIPEYFYVRGSDEFGIYPIPSATVSNGGRLNYERRMRDMSVADYTAGTITLTNSSNVVTGSGTTFTSAMIGRTLIASDANGDGMAYKITEFTSTTALRIENNYGGTTASGMSYVIGEVPDIPEEFHESLVDYGCYRYYRRRRDTGLAREMKAAFAESLGECISNYSSKTGSQYIRPVRLRSGYSNRRRDYPVV